jgi:osmotically-inducible protein OsmY
MKTSEILKQKIIDHLTWDDRIDSNDVYVYVEDGNVQLRGSVPTFSAKLAASKDAQMIDGVTNVDNQLEVSYPQTEEVLNDNEITSNIVNMLLWNSNIVSSDIVVKSQNRIVTLTGSVETYWEKYLAEDIANSAKGVIQVINLLDVELTKSKVDLDIQGAIEDALNRTSTIRSDNINVSVNNGIVTLTGNVGSFAEKEDIMDIARYTTGVVSVIDEITIENQV